MNPLVDFASFVAPSTPVCPQLQRVAYSMRPAGQAAPTDAEALMRESAALQAAQAQRSAEQVRSMATWYAVGALGGWLLGAYGAYYYIKRAASR